MIYVSSIFQIQKQFHFVIDFRILCKNIPVWWNMFSRKSTATNKILYKTKTQCIIELRLEAFCCGLTCSKWLCEHSMIFTKITPCHMITCHLRNLHHSKINIWTWFEQLFFHFNESVFYISFWLNKNLCQNDDPVDL